MPKIKEIRAREILDSRGNPTIETRVELISGISAKASVPSGASTGRHEAIELRDGDKNRYHGQGVLKAVNNVNAKINKKLKGLSAVSQENIDKTMIALDGTENKQKLGANAILSVSLACARAGAQAKKQELYQYINSSFKFKKKPSLPIPSFNIFNGGRHADTNLDFQEFMIIPQIHDANDANGMRMTRIANNANKNINSRELKTRIAANKDTNSHESNWGRLFAERVRAGAEIFHELGYVLKEAGFDTDVGNEGGYAPNIVSSVQAIELILAAITRAGYKPGREIGLGIDVGSSELYNPETKRYIFKLDRAHFSSATLKDLYYEWFRKFPIISLEDGLAEDDWEGWRELTRELGGEIMLIGDDLFATNIKRLRKGIKEKAANAILIKLNQVGTLTETIECVKLANRHNYKIMVSHRSGETCDDFIADLAVAVSADYIKSGSLSRSERLAKYNRLMEIELLVN